jgi:hypothetical protein
LKTHDPLAQELQKRGLQDNANTTFVAREITHETVEPNDIR